MQRTKQSVKNAITFLICYGIQMVFQIVARFFFIRLIGKEYLGLNSLFTDLLTALQLVELGIGPAIAYSLYKPLAEGDHEKIKSIMNLFKIAYRLIGIIILVVGLAFTPFYKIFIKDIPQNIVNIDLIYILFVVNTAVSYFYSYNRTLLISDQKKYLDTIVQSSVTAIYTIAQIIILYLTHNYIYYLVAQIMGTVLINLIASIIVFKKYPYLREKEVKKLNSDVSKEIKKNTLAMVFHKVGSIVRDATDNILISKFVGLAITGMYANYSMITKVLANLINQVFAAVLSSVGNLHATSSEDAQRRVFYNINFINFCIAIFCSCCFGALINPFILIIADKSYLLGYTITALISLKFYLDIMRKAPWMFCEAAGVYWQGKIKPILEVIVNLVASIVLVQFIGLAGIFIGTIITIIVVDIPMEPYLAFKYVLKEKPLKYYLKYLYYIGVTAVTYAVSVAITSVIPGDGIIMFALKGLITVAIIPIIVTIATFRTSEFKYVKDLFINFLINIKNKILKSSVKTR